MMINATALKDYRLACTDGQIGKVKEFYFDDRYWAVRYLIVDTGNWLTGREVLISPLALKAVHHNERTISVALSKQQIAESPALDSDKPVSRQFEQEYYRYYGWPGYWEGSFMWGSSPFLMAPAPYLGTPYDLEKREKWKPTPREENSWDPHLRSTKAMSGRHIEATDGGIGHVEDFIIDDQTWAIRYLVIDTRNWWPGKKVLLAPHWIEDLNWGESKVSVNLSRAKIRQSPEYTEISLLTRDYETRLHRNYDRKGYWMDQPVPKSVADTTVAHAK
jgi:uncharacterized protein YrrD